MLLVAGVAAAALFIDGYSYIYRLINHIPFNAPIQTAPQLFNRDLFIHKGLDLQGGSEIVLEIDPATLSPGTTLSQAQQSTVQVMEKRVNGIGVSEASVQTQGDRRVVVQLPGVAFDRARDIVGKTARLTLRTWVPASTSTTDGKVHISEDLVDPQFVPPTELVDVAGPPPHSVAGRCVGAQDCIPAGYLPHEFGVDGSHITTADVGFDTNKNEPTVNFTLDDSGSTLLGTTTADMPSKQPPDSQLAIFLDNQLINNAIVQQALNNGQVEISGGQVSTDSNYRNDLAATLAAGRLPGKINIVEANSVGATLGFDSVRKSFIAGGIGLAVVVIFMISYYRLPGLVASLALAVYAATTLALFKLIPVTLTLAGMAGFVLSVGMAVDANVLIFERLREELRNGRTLAAAAEAAVTRAWPSIRDSNISTLITCFVLFFQDRIPFLVGFTLAKGFALTLGIGVLVSMFSAIIVTQTILQVAIRLHGIRRPFLFAVERVQ